MSSLKKITQPRKTADLGSAMTDLAERLSKTVGKPEAVPDAAMQQLFAAMIRVYGAKTETGAELRPFPPKAGVTATAVMSAATAMMHGVNVALFELGIWQAWTGTCIPQNQRAARDMRRVA